MERLIRNRDGVFFGEASQLLPKQLIPQSLTEGLVDGHDGREPAPHDEAVEGGPLVSVYRHLRRSEGWWGCQGREGGVSLMNISNLSPSNLIRAPGRHPCDPNSLAFGLRETAHGNLLKTGSKLQSGPKP